MGEPSPLVAWPTSLPSAPGTGQQLAEIAGKRVEDVASAGGGRRGKLTERQQPGFGRGGEPERPAPRQFPLPSGPVAHPLDVSDDLPLILDGV